MKRKTTESQSVPHQPQGSLRHFLTMFSISSLISKSREQIIGVLLTVGINLSLGAWLLTNGKQDTESMPVQDVTEVLLTKFSPDALEKMPFSDTVFEREKIKLSAKFGPAKTEELIQHARKIYIALLLVIKKYSTDHTPQETATYLTEYLGAHDPEQPFVTVLLNQGSGNCDGRAALVAMVFNDLFPEYPVHTESGYMQNADGSLSPHARSIISINSNNIVVERKFILTPATNAFSLPMDLHDMNERRHPPNADPVKISPLIAGKHVHRPKNDGALEFPPLTSLFHEYGDNNDPTPLPPTAEDERRIDAIRNLGMYVIEVVTDPAHFGLHPAQERIRKMLESGKIPLNDWGREDQYGNYHAILMYDGKGHSADEIMARLQARNSELDSLDIYATRLVYVADPVILPIHIQTINNNQNNNARMIRMMGPKMSLAAAQEFAHIYPIKSLKITVDEFDPRALQTIVDVIPLVPSSLTIEVPTLSIYELFAFLAKYNARAGMPPVDHHILRFKFTCQFDVTLLNAFRHIPTDLDIQFPENSITASTFNTFLMSSLSPYVTVDGLQFDASFIATLKHAPHTKTLIFNIRLNDGEFKDIESRAIQEGIRVEYDDQLMRLQLHQ